jgi:hypothetical protein
MKMQLKKKLFSLSMATVMVYGMETYNAFLRARAMRSSNFLVSPLELLILVPVVIILQSFIGGPSARYLAGKVCKDKIQGKARGYLVMPFFTVLIMCPLMSAVATLLFKDFSDSPIRAFMQTYGNNLPMAFVWQIMIAGPLLRCLFDRIPVQAA